MSVSKIYKTRLVSVAADNESGKEIRKILEKKGFVGASCTFVHESENQQEPMSVKVYLDGTHIGYLMRGVAKVLAPQMDAGKVVHGYIKELSYYDQSKESITRWDTSGDDEQLTNCYINVWTCDTGDDESACYALLKEQAAAAGVIKTEPQKETGGKKQAAKATLEKKSFFSKLFGSRK